jgi:hypothetical protein
MREWHVKLLSHLISQHEISYQIRELAKVLNLKGKEWKLLEEAPPQLQRRMAVGVV